MMTRSGSKHAKQHHPTSTANEPALYFPHAQVKCRCPPLSWFRRMACNCKRSDQSACYPSSCR
jgi:hypothetical protein